MPIKIGVCASAMLLALAFAASAQESTQSDPPAAATYLLAADTEVHLRLLELVASNKHKHGDRFALEVVDPVRVEGVVVIPAGARGEGEVVHAAKGGFGGRAGELILASRFVRVGDQTVKLRSFSAGSGENRVNLAMGLSVVMIGLFVTGKDITLPAGTDVFAKVAADASLSSTPATGPEPVDALVPTIPEQPSTEIDKNAPSQQ